MHGLTLHPERSKIQIESHIGHHGMARSSTCQLVDDLERRREVTVAGNPTPKVFLEVVPVMYPVHSTQNPVSYLQFVGSTINNVRKSNAGRASLVRWHGQKSQKLTMRWLACWQLNQGCRKLLSVDIWTPRCFLKCWFLPLGPSLYSPLACESNSTVSCSGIETRLRRTRTDLGRDLVDPRGGSRVRHQSGQDHEDRNARPRSCFSFQCRGVEVASYCTRRVFHRCWIAVLQVLEA